MSELKEMKVAMARLEDQNTMVLLRLQQHKEEVMKHLHLVVLGQRGQFYKNKEVFQQLKGAFEEISNLYE